MQQKNNENLIDSTMQNEQSTCRICLEEFQINDPYSKWPCPSPKPHIFHDDCMLNMLRTKNTCPICRHPIEAGHIGDSFARQFFTRLVL
jgi:E3 ubiquitin-protein ligase DOA10